MKHVICWASLTICGVASAQTVVQKTAEPFENAPWRVTDDSSAGGKSQLIDEVAANIGASVRALQLQADFSGKGFEFFKAAPLQSLTIPGHTKRLTVWVRADAKYGWALQFKDGWGRSEVAGAKLEWNLTKDADNTWKKVSFAVPENWVQPLTIDGVLAHNWAQQSEKASAQLKLDVLQVETDISQVDENGVLKTWQPPPLPPNPTEAQKSAQKAPVTPLLATNWSSPAEHNVFSGANAQFLLQVQNWRALPAVGALQWNVADDAGARVQNGEQKLEVIDNFALQLPLSARKFGVYRLQSALNWADGTKSQTAEPFALIPIARPLDAAQKDASPYGLNVLSARQPMVGTFAKAGVTWFRDYGFNLTWMVRAKGEDGKYGGWPWYPKIVREYERHDVRVLANMQSALQPPSDGKTAPDLSWIRDVVGVQTAFPFLRTFELDNEYDLHAPNIRAEEAIGWKNYGNYHKKFGEITHLLSNGEFLAVENGRAGVWPERVRQMVQSGAFANIDVINSHHYTGTDAPETNVANHNMGFSGDEQVMSFFDQLRAAKKAGSSDGKVRQHWLTEFGWDTKAGPIVSAQHQAAYLQRAYMMLLAAGTEKGFWYWDLDMPKATQFFDGCGLFTHDQKPKLSYAAYAGLTQILPSPTYIGTINEGENTRGYLFRNNNQLVAALWTLDGSKGPTIDFGNAKTFDSFANPLDKNQAQLGLSPVFAVGVAPDHRWVKQANYSLESPHLVSVTAGDTVNATLRVSNSRAVAIKGEARLQLPSGWSQNSTQTPIEVAPGKSVDVPLSFRVGTNEVLGEKRVGLQISEGEPLHFIPLRVHVQRPIVMTVRALKGEPGNSDVSIRLSNRSAQPLSGKLKFVLPSGWKAQTPEIAIENLKPMEVRDVRAQILWTPTWKANESAIVVFRSSDDRTAQQPLIVPQLTIARAPNLKMDGDLKDWPSQSKMPTWVLGSTQGEGKSDLYLAWSPLGLNVALDVRDSKATVPDARSFWVGDVLEMFVDTRDKKTTRTYERGDHQFWLAPQFETKRVYVGQWKRNSEIPETRYDIAGIQSAVVRTTDGYRLECLLPTALLQGFKPAVGAKLGLNVNLSVKGSDQDREVFWPLRKSDAAEQPATWGTITLGE